MVGALVEFHKAQNIHMVLMKGQFYQVLQNFELRHYGGPVLISLVFLLDNFHGTHELCWAVDAGSNLPIGALVRLVSYLFREHRRFHRNRRSWCPFGPCRWLPERKRAGKSQCGRLRASSLWCKQDCKWLPSKIYLLMGSSHNTRLVRATRVQLLKYCKNLYKQSLKRSSSCSSSISRTQLHALTIQR